MKRSAVAGLSTLLLAVGLSAPCAFGAGAPSVVEGVLTRVTATEVQLDHRAAYQFNPALATCFDFRGDAMTCETLVGIGYADRARVTLHGTVVQRIDILELQQ